MKLRSFEAFAGYGSQSMSGERYCGGFESVGISEVDESAIISYAAVHCEDRDVNFPPVDKMLEILISCNIGLNFKNGILPWTKMLETFNKKGSISKGNLERVKRISKACLLTKNYGDISKINPSIIPDHDLFTYSFPCFVAGTQVLTAEGYQNIEDIKKNDLVMTHRNRFMKVVKPMANKADHLLKVSTMISDALLTTKEHPFYVREMKRRYTSRKGGEKQKKYREFLSPKWIEAGDLLKSHYVGTPINTRAYLPRWDGCINNQWGHNRKIDNLSKHFESKDFWWFVGRYIGDGWTQNFPDKHKYRTIICCAKEESGEIEPILRKLGWNYTKCPERNIYKYHICNKELSLWLDTFGKYAHGKKLTNDILDLPIIFLKEFIEGYFSADGYYSEKDKLYKITSVSKNLIYSLGQCIAKVYNRPFSVYKTKRRSTCVIEGRTVNQRDSYQLSFKIDNGVQDKAFYEKGYIWSPVNSIEKIGYKGPVYNMEVEEDNSYCVQNIIVHNCQDISMAGKQRGLEEGTETRSSLLWECQKIVELKRPPYLMMENVKNLVGKKHRPDFDRWLEVLEGLGYQNHWKVINAKNCGVPQNRERVFCVSILGGGDFSFYDDFDSDVRLKDVLEDDVDEKYYLSDSMAKGFIEKAPQLGYINQDTQASKVISDTEVFQTLCAGTHGYANGYVKKTCIDKSINNTREIEIANCITAREDRGISNRGGEGTAVIEKNEIDVVGRVDLNGHDLCKRIYNPKGICPTVTSGTSGNTTPKIIGTNNINKVLDIPKEILNDNERQRRFYGVDGVSPGVLARTDSPKIIKACAIRGRNPSNPKSRESGLETVQMLEVSKNPDINNCLTTVQKDSLVLESNKLNMVGMLDIKGNESIRRVYDPKGLSPALTTMQGGNRQPKIIEPYRIRKLTPRECFRLMGVSDSDIDKIQAAGISNSQQYKMAGNSIVVNCMKFLEQLKPIKGEDN